MTGGWHNLLDFAGELVRPMLPLRWTVLDGLQVFAAGVIAAAVLAGVFAVCWWLNRPNEKVGSLRRGLEHISQKTADRDQQMRELIEPPTEGR